MTTMELKRGDWVQVQTGDLGIVQRVSKRQAWADVLFTSWTKRMKREHLTFYSRPPQTGPGMYD
ncbi:hypothetical protein JDW19_02505 [Paenibacillus polymyxa]|uniref:Uncharacterized protein n=1 Tax=Paenibacillus polymyxa TaxID=1406 RepID=A0A8I1IT19_PAEPO|nr:MULTISPECIES: hypothetical protein [Paenibacillus]KAF6576555.1 hypothetical protein G9G53_01190 [Paenibacillus sp. EKM206P]KAF6591311.1 hypothetical protein G9G52_02775 [Paenibacillus sp. EKM205P]MBM0632000.1 hypothetical protein [Paenibacillus polymyxa]